MNKINLVCNSEIIGSFNKVTIYFRYLDCPNIDYLNGELQTAFLLEDGFIYSSFIKQEYSRFNYVGRSRCINLEYTLDNVNYQIIRCLIDYTYMPSTDTNFDLVGAIYKLPKLEGVGEIDTTKFPIEQLKSGMVLIS
jgi:hypothetical protein